MTILLPDDPFCFAPADFVMMKMEALRITQDYGMIMLIAGLAIGAMLGVGVYRALVHPGWLINRVRSL